DNTEMLRTVLEAIDESREIHLHYRHNYDPAREERTVVKPIGVKLFRQRWYLIAETAGGEAYSYALDRILHIAKGATIVPSSITLDALFADSYGIIREPQTTSEEIELRVEREQANYFLSLPLHPSQELSRYEDGYAIFRLRVAPTYDFIMDILSHGDKVEVLAPQSLRDTIRAKLKTVLNLYNQ
ncbi:MAG: WYL domain-containing protein, partial [Duncaniella sp.]|nr:WYL domain-containing protein [Duncaniella sp.]